MSINGTRGRVELSVVERGTLSDVATIDPSAHPQIASDLANAHGTVPIGERLVLQRHWEDAQVIPIESGGGGHGGGDAGLLQDVLRGPSPDQLGRPASWHDGVRAVCVGIAGNESFETGYVISTAATLANAPHAPLPHEAMEPLSLRTARWHDARVARPCRLFGDTREPGRCGASPLGCQPSKRRAVLGWVKAIVADRRLRPNSTVGTRSRTVYREPANRYMGEIRIPDDWKGSPSARPKLNLPRKPARPGVRGCPELRGTSVAAR